MIGFNHDRVLNGNHESTLKHNKQQSSSNKISIKNDDSTSILSNSWTIGNTTEKFDVHEIDLTKTPIQVKILYEANNNEQNTTTNARKIECDINENCTSNDNLTKGQTLLTSYFRPIERKSTINSIDGGNDAKNNDLDDDDDDDDEYDNPLEIDYAPTSDLTSDSEKTDQKCLLFHRKRIRRKYNRISTVRQRSIELLVRLARTIRNRFTPNWHRFSNKNVLFVYQCLISFHRFTSEFVKQTEQSVTTFNQHKLKMTTEAITINRRVQKLLNDNNTNAKETNDDAAVVVTTVATPNHNDGGAKRPPKSQRSSDNSRLLLLTENAHESSEKDFGKTKRHIFIEHHIGFVIQ